VPLGRDSANLLEEKLRSANVVCWVPSKGRSPGHYGKDEHGQECESQRRGRHGISIAPHGYEKSGNGCGTQGDDQGEQEAHATFLPALFMPSILFLLRGMTMRVRNRSTFRQCESFYGTQRIAADAMSDKTGGVRHDDTDQNT
jgi:hypothetical protein